MIIRHFVWECQPKTRIPELRICNSLFLESASEAKEVKLKDDTYAMHFQYLLKRRNTYYPNLWLASADKDPVVQSIVSLTISLRHKFVSGGGGGGVTRR